MKTSKEAHDFYRSPEWKAARAAYFISKDGLCERCGKAGLIVHHKRRLNAKNTKDWNVSSNFENLELLCLECHNTEHKAVDSTKRAGMSWERIMSGVTPPRGSVRM